MNLTNARAVLLAGVAALCLAAGGCGSDDEDDGGRSQAAQVETGSAPGTGATGDPDERQIRLLFERMRKAIAARDGETACESMTRLSRQTFVRIAQNGPKSCEQGFKEAFANGTSEDLQPKLVRVEVRGPRATVYARATTSKGLQQAPFVKESGSWKVESWLTD